MKFGDKYELLESLTTGGVETFVADDKIRGERVLVHILQCDPQKANQPTVQWVLEGFRKLAPEPVATVLETGRYSGTLYAYLVSKMPEAAALAVWVRRYEAQSRDTQEFPAPPGKPTPQSEAPTGEVPQAEAPKAAGPITQLFREFDMQANSGAAAVPPPDVRQPSPPPPKVSPVSATADRSGVRAAPSWDLEAPRVSPSVGTEPSITTPASSFRPDFGVNTFPSKISPAPVKDDPKPGEFTSFFQGPFRGDRPSETPTLSPPQEAPRKSVGDFTAMFGPVKPPVEESLPSSGIAGNEPAGTGFTGWFNSGVSSGTSGTAAPPPPAGLPRPGIDPLPVVPQPVFPAPPKESFLPPPAVSYVPPPPPIFPSPAPLNPPVAKPPAMPASDLPSGGATRAFVRPVAEPAPGPPPPPSGPSAYTQIISVKAVNPDAAEKKDAAANSPAPPAFALPAITLPSPPKPPKLPKVEVTAPPVSYWPLVLTLTVLFFAAVLLVLYFVLKH